MSIEHLVKVFIVKLNAELPVSWAKTQTWVSGK